MKETVVQWDAEAYEAFKELQRAVSSGEKSRTKPSYAQLLSSIEHAIERLRKDPFCGDLIPRKYLTKAVVEEYGTDKIFRIELVGYWRMLYTVVGEQTRIIALILEYMNHAEYNKKFNYRKR